MTVRDPLESPEDEMGASPTEEANFFGGFVSSEQVAVSEEFVGVIHEEEHYSKQTG